MGSIEFYRVLRGFYSVLRVFYRVLWGSIGFYGGYKS